MEELQQQSVSASSISTSTDTQLKPDSTLIHALSFTLFTTNTSIEFFYELTDKLFDIPYSEFELRAKSKERKDYYRTMCSYRNMINIYSDPVGYNVNTVSIEIKGTACDELNLDFKLIAGYIYNNGAKVSVLHLANDDTKGLLEMNKIIKAHNKETYTSACNGSKHDKTSGQASVIFGKDPLRIIFYDKQIEQKTEYKWVRCELQMRKDLAHSAFKDFHDGIELGTISKGILLDKLKFRNEREKDKNKARRNIAPWWIKFLGDIEARKYSKAKVEPNNERQINNLIGYLKKRFDNLGSVNVFKAVAVASGEMAEQFIKPESLNLVLNY